MRVSSDEQKLFAGLFYEPPARQHDNAFRISPLKITAATLFLIQLLGQPGQK